MGSLTVNPKKLEKAMQVEDMGWGWIISHIWVSSDQVKKKG